MDRKHIYRDYNASHTNRIRYDKDNFRVSIKKFDKSNEIIHKATKPSTFTTNGQKTTICGFTCYQAPVGKSNLTLSFSFKPTVSGYYRIEMLYANARRTLSTNEEKDDIAITGTCNITNATLTKSSQWAGVDIVHNRHYDYFTVAPNQVGKTVGIEYSMSPNACFIALVIKHYDIWQGDRHNQQGHELTITKANITKTNEFEPDEMTVELMYYHGLDDKQEIGTNTANLSGYLFDYRDEINFYITNTNGIEQQVFGGYISTITVDEDLTTMTLDCISRLNDLDHRYNISEIGMNSVSENDIDYSSCYDYFHNFKKWNKSLKYLCNLSELPLNCTVNYDTTSEHDNITVNYGSSNYNKFTKKYMLATLYSKKVLLRNSPTRNVTQSIRIFDDKLAKWNDEVVISNDGMQNIRLEYGLGTHKWTHTVLSDDDDSSANSSATISTSVKTQAKNITSLLGTEEGGTSANNTKICKKIVKWVGANITHTKNYSGFQRKPSTVLAKKVANCCDKSRLVAEMCMARGVPASEIWYIHPKGHVFLRLCGVVSDPSCRPYWNYHCPSWSVTSNVCHPPNLPI